MANERRPVGAASELIAASKPIVSRCADIAREPTMTKAERTELGTLARMRAKVAKDQVDSVAAERVATAEAQLSAIYASDDQLWKAATDVAKAAIADANRVIAEQWRAAGKPLEFAPQAGFGWAGRGENAMRERRGELRTALRTRVAADAKQAKASIEAAAVEIRTELVQDGLTSTAAREFLRLMPSPAALLPALDVEKLQGELSAEKAAQIQHTIDLGARWAR